MVTPRVRSNGLKPIIDHLKMVKKLTGPHVFMELSRIIYSDGGDDIPSGLLTECDNLLYTLREDYPDGFTLTGFNVKIKPIRESRGLAMSRVGIDDAKYLGDDYDDYPL